jgi:hypothetical protein
MSLESVLIILMLLCVWDTDLEIPETSENWDFHGD